MEDKGIILAAPGITKNGSTRVKGALAAGRGFAAALVGLLLLASCESIPGNKDGKKQTPFEQYLTAYCQAVERCTTSHGRVFPEVRVCKDFIRSAVECGFSHRDYTSGEAEISKYQWLGHSVTPCAKALQKVSCRNLLTEPPQACGELFSLESALGFGDRCSGRAWVCQNGLRCNSHGEGSCRYCGHTAGEGADCSSSAQSCDSSHYCETGSWQCAKQKGTGEQCAKDTECLSASCRRGVCTTVKRGDSCGANSPCSWYLICRDGVCQDRGSEGATCSNTSQCLNGLYCNGKCRPYSHCAYPTDYRCAFPEGSCMHAIYCDAPSFDCLQKVTPQAHCDRTDWACLGRLSCDWEPEVNTCQDRLPEGENCTVNSQCLSDLCNEHWNHCLDDEC